MWQVLGQKYHHRQLSRIPRSKSANTIKVTCWRWRVLRQQISELSFGRIRKPQTIKRRRNSTWQRQYAIDHPILRGKDTKIYVGGCCWVERRQLLYHEGWRIAHDECSIHRLFPRTNRKICKCNLHKKQTLSGRVEKICPFSWKGKSNQERHLHKPFLQATRRRLVGQHYQHYQAFGK